MKVLSTIAVLSLVFMIESVGQAADDVDAQVVNSRELVQAFAKNLKAELQHAMEAGGPIEAIDVCQTVAPEIATQQSQDAGWDIGRTALRLRNPMNAPDLWERAILEQFEARKAQGEDVRTLEQHETINENGQRYFRYMKAIPIAELCTTCHGTDLTPDVRAKLADLYPDDRATGFEGGDIRGAFTLKKLVD